MTSPGEIAGLGVVVAAAVIAVAMTTRGGARVGLLSALLALTGGAVALIAPTRRGGAAPPPSKPGPSTGAEWVGSAACLPCHPGEYASFSRTYHRTMTQVASPSTVLAPLDGRPLRLEDGRIVRLERRGDEVWATLPDPDDVIAGIPAPDVTRRVVLTTGSHREQAYWVPGRRAGDLRLVPFVWLVREGAFVARGEAFITPPGRPLPPVRWASSCIACHAVAGEPRHDPERDVFDTRAAELGVACEACHGPGAAHVDRHRDPVTRYAQRASGRPDPTIIHPGRLLPERSGAVCGQCHAYAFPRDEDGFWTDGYSRAFRAGDLLEPSRTLITASNMGTRGAPVIDAPADALFWPDGAVRVGGREYNGLVESPCWQRGEGERKMTCLSCHSMHGGEPAGQIAKDRAGDRGCTSCHAAAGYGPAHTRHAEGSAGSACVSCHMPKTSYALLSAVRSHRIDSPHTSALSGTKPNACNLCHLDRTLAWTARWLSDWYGQPPVTLAGDRAELASALRDGISGDAGLRALVADALGSDDAIAASGGGWRRALLEQMRRDPYAAVRFIAERSLRKLSALPPATLKPEQASAFAIGPNGEIEPERLRALIKARDERAVTIAE
jgi:hypothetical protein